MKKFTILMLLVVAALCSIQLSAKEGGDIPPTPRSNNYTSIPSYYHRLGDDSHMYYNIREDGRRLAGPEYQHAVSIIGEISGRYFSSTYGNTNYDDGYGSGFLAAIQVSKGDTNYDAKYVNSLIVDEVEGAGVTVETSVEGHGDNAARIIYTLTNNSEADVTVQFGVYGDIMIGNDDNAILTRMMHDEEAYGMKLKGKSQGSLFNPITPIMSVLFGEGVTGVTPADKYWFGFFSSNWHANEIVGNYSDNIYSTGTATYDQTYARYYMQEATNTSNSYDSGMGFCWNNRPIPAGESIELSFVIAIGEVDFEEPIPDPEDPEGQDIFTYNVEVENIGDENINDPWNDLTVAHPARIYGQYEHPYGQNGYIEYRVDGATRAWTGEWTRIETPLISGDPNGYDLPFDMFFNPDEAELHTLELRFTDGLGNYTELDGLEWEDIRTISLTVDPQVQAYDGTPKIFVVTVGGVIDYTLGEDGEYTNPGDYSQSIWGQFDMNTIGINTVEFTVTKGQAVVDVQSPGNVEYDGNPHGATVTLITGDTEPIVTYYMVDEDGNQHEIEGVPTLEGVYVVEVVVPESEFYFGTEASAGPYMIFRPTGVEELTIGSEDNGAWYTIDGRRIVAPTERGIYIHNGKKYIVM